MVRKSPRLADSVYTGRVAGTSGSAQRIHSLADMPGRGRAVCRGYVESITILPAGESACFTAVVMDLDERQDHAHSLAERGRQRLPPQRSRARLIWLGQRMVPGIEAGVELTFEGMVQPVAGLPTIYNPRYEIIGRPRENQ